MKLTVNVDLEDFFQNEDETLQESIVRAIETSVIRRLEKDFREKIKDDFYKKIIEKFLSEKDAKVKEIIEKAFDEEKVKKSYYSDDMVTYTEYVTEVLKRDLNSPDLDRKIKAVSDKVSATAFEEMKKRYDVYFAAQIIEKLSAAGMLAQGVAESILKQ